VGTPADNSTKVGKYNLSPLYQKGAPMKNHRFLLAGEINNDQLAAFIACDAEAGPGELLINSTGGDLIAGLALYDYIRCFSPAWRATVVGSCFSSAMMPLLACSSRAITPNGALMMHGGTASITGIPNAEVAAFARDAQHVSARYHLICRERSRATERQIDTLSKAGKYIYPDEAITLGLIHKFVPFTGTKKISNRKKADVRSSGSR
jgi:ATP-dependent protease ClpP protease subunit